MTHHFLMKLHITLCLDPDIILNFLWLLWTNERHSDETWSYHHNTILFILFCLLCLSGVGNHIMYREYNTTWRENEYGDFLFLGILVGSDLFLEITKVRGNTTGDRAWDFSTFYPFVVLLSSPSPLIPKSRGLGLILYRAGLTLLKSHRPPNPL